jgi:RNA polymerase sigma factor (sigma-70 family)
MSGNLPVVAQDAFRQELGRNYARVFRFALKLTGGRKADAEDLTQQTFLKALASCHLFIEGSNMAAWLSVICRNTHFSDHRKKSRMVEDPDGLIAARRGVPPNQLEHLELEDTWRAIRQLPESHREALMHVGLHGERYDEAAINTENLVGTVKSRVNRARQQVRSLLEASGPALPASPTPSPFEALLSSPREMPAAPQRAHPHVPLLTIHEGEAPMNIPHPHANGHAPAQAPAPADSAAVYFLPPSRTRAYVLKDFEQARGIVMGRIGTNREDAMKLIREVTDELVDRIEKARMRKEEFRAQMLNYLRNNVYVALANGRAREAVDHLCDGFFKQGVPLSNVNGQPLLSASLIKDMFETTTPRSASFSLWVAMSEMMKARVGLGVPAKAAAATSLTPLPALAPAPDRSETGLAQEETGPAVSPAPQGSAADVVVEALRHVIEGWLDQGRQPLEILVRLECPPEKQVEVLEALFRMQAARRGRQPASGR